MITPVSMDDRITFDVYGAGNEKNYEYLFRLNLTGTQAGYSLAAYVNQLGFKKTAIFYSDDRICKYLTDSFDDEQSYKYKAPIIDRICQYGNDKKIDKIIERWKALDCDSVVINNLNVNYTLSFIDRMSKNGLDVPIILTNNYVYDNAEILDYIESLVEGEVYVLPLFHTDMEHGRVKEFSEKFQEEYGESPDWIAMQSYEMVMIAASAAENCEIITRENLAVAMHETKGFKGILGDYSIDEKGDLWGKNYALYRYEDGEFIFVDYDEETLKGED
jgi:branched-chain amino acid transport system substrate-binding protein